MTLVMLLDQLEDLIDTAPEIPFTGRALVDGDQILELIAKVREALPEGFRALQEAAAEREEIIRKSQEEAMRIIKEAQEEAARLVSEHELARRASEEAERLLEEARRRAKELQAEADRYAAQVLDRLQGSLERTLEVVRKGRAELQV